MGTQARPDRRALTEQAARRQGIFTLTEALSCGYTQPLIFHLVRTGRFEQYGRAFYRLTDYHERKPSGFQNYPRTAR